MNVIDWDSIESLTALTTGIYSRICIEFMWSTWSIFPYFLALFPLLVLEDRVYFIQLSLLNATFHLCSILFSYDSFCTIIPNGDVYYFVASFCSSCFSLINTRFSYVSNLIILGFISSFSNWAEYLITVLSTITIQLLPLEFLQFSPYEVILFGQLVNFCLRSVYFEIQNGVHHENQLGKILMLVQIGILTSIYCGKLLYYANVT